MQSGARDLAPRPPDNLITVIKVPMPARKGP